MSQDFELHTLLSQFLGDPHEISSEFDVHTLSQKDVETGLNDVIDSIGESSDAITREEIFDILKGLSKSFGELNRTTMTKLLDVVISGLNSQADAFATELESPEPEGLESFRRPLEMYSFLLLWILTSAETVAGQKTAATTRENSRGRQSKSKQNAATKDQHQPWDYTPQLQTAFDVMCKMLKLKLAKLWTITSEKDSFVSLYTRPAYLVAENEARLKNNAIKMRIFKTLCLAVKHQQHGIAAQTAIVQNLQYYEHLSEPMAEFLQILSEQYDYPHLADEILRDLSSKEFNNNDSKGPKSVAAFLVKLSELVPRSVLKQMTLLLKLLDSESHTMRCAMIEVCGNMISDLVQQEDQSEATKAQIDSFFELLEERVLDVNPYCRSKLFQVYWRLLSLPSKFPKRRQRICEICVRSLEDKSSHVRRNVIKLLSKLISTHPFALLHGGQLSYNDWRERLEAVTDQINSIPPPSDTPGLIEEIRDAADDEMNMAKESKNASEDPSIVEGQPRPTTGEDLMKLQLTKRYYTEALKFVESLHEASEIVSQLLASKNKSEVIESMDFFVIADAYKLATAKSGIKKMMHLVWTKSNSDEGKGVQNHLIECYKGLFFDAPDHLSPSDAATYIARNLISLTYGSTLAELISLEQLLCNMMKQGEVSSVVIGKLWQVYGFQKNEISKTQRRGAIIILGMLALADSDIVAREIDTLLNIGLGPLGQADLDLARYSCIALQRLNMKHKKGTFEAKPSTKLPLDHPVFTKLRAIIQYETELNEWFGVAEQALNAIYLLASQPDTLCGDVVREKTRLVFSQDHPAQESNESPEDSSVSGNNKSTSRRLSSSRSLSQLLFIVGHVAIKQIIHIELCEAEFKRRKVEQEKTKQTDGSTTTGNKEQDDLEMIGGTSEDDFSEAIALVREKELLFGPQSLLARYGPLIVEVCTKPEIYKDSGLQTAAALALGKFMCVSSEFCDAHLPLLLTIMERSKNPIIRSNAVISLGDMTVCFNRLIDENTDFLYRRLSDRDTSVKKTCLMTLTFLILAGQVKVKGQLGEMAKCLEDGDRRIADLAKMFFTELSTKDNAIYNGFTDIFSILSSAEKPLEEDSLRRIVKFLMSFIEKEKHAKQLAEKLASRLPRCETERQWNEVAYALSLLPHKNEDIQKVIGEGFRYATAVAK